MAEFQIKGWCPSALRPMPSGDGLVVRIRPPLARLTGVQARGLAEAAATHGNGLIDLSSRGNIQLRGIRDGIYQALLDDLRNLGLVRDEAAGNIVVTPFWQPNDGTAELVAALENIVSQAPVLPDKFGFAVDTGPQPVLAGISADIRLERAADGRLILRPDGLLIGRVVTMESAAVAALELAQWFVSSGGVQQGRGRMAAHLGRGARLPEGFDHATAGALTPAKIGRHPLGFMAGFEFGQIDSATLAALANQPLRITPWRSVLLEGVTEAPAIASLLTDLADPRLRVIACTGAPGCPQALQPTRPLARQLAPLVRPGHELHVSGCAKGCAHPGPAEVTLRADAAGFGVIRNGRAGDPCTERFDGATALFKVT